MVTIYIDSNVIIASQLDDEKHHAESKHFMQKVQGTRESDTYYVTSVFTFLELASAMIRRTRNEDKALALLYKIRNSWKKSIRPVPPLGSRQLTSFTALIESLIDSAIKFRTPSADTIHAQSVYLYDLDYLVTWNVEDFVHLKESMRNLTVLNPSQMLMLLKDEATEKEVTQELVTPQVDLKKLVKERPDYMTSWNARLQWVLPTTRDLALKLIRRLETDLTGVKHQARFRWYSFYRREPFVRRNGVATVLIGRKTVKLSIRVNPAKFNDPFGIFKPMAGFFYDEEFRAPITSGNIEAVVSVASLGYQGLISADPSLQNETLRVLVVRRHPGDDKWARLQIGNFGIGSVQLSDYEVGAWGKHSAGTGRIIEPGKSIILSITANPGKFQMGQSYDVHVWTKTGTMFPFRVVF